MASMKVNLGGLFRNVADSIPHDQRSYHAFCLGEVLGHLKAVVAGKHTIEEFAEHYCLAALPSKPEGRTWPVMQDEVDDCYGRPKQP